MTDSTGVAQAPTEALAARRIDHVGVVVRDMDSAIAHFGTRYGFAVDKDWTEPSGRFRLVYLAAGETTLQLVTPLREGPLATFLEERGEGLHHICIEVDELDAAVSAVGARIEADPYLSGRGARVCFLSERSCGVLVELTEPSTPAPPWTTAR